MKVWNRKKTIILFILCLLLMMVLGGCGFRRSVKYMFGGGVNTQYKEYKKAIKPTRRKDLLVKHFEEDTDNIIRFTFIADGIKGGKSLADLVDAHNAFVQENPDYFDENTSFTITEDAGMNGVDYEDFTFLSDLRNVNTNKQEGSKTTRRDYAEDLGRTNNMQLQYLWINQTDYLGYEFAEIGFKAPVALIDTDWEDELPTYKFKCLSGIQGLEQVVLMNCNDSYDKDTVINEIHKVVPDVDVYIQLYDENNDSHLENICE